jgi:hypothetical protein
MRTVVTRGEVVGEGMRVVALRGRMKIRTKMGLRT